MPSKMTNAYREHEGGSIIVSEQYHKGVAELRKARAKNARIDRKLRRARQAWTFYPPSPMTITLLRDVGLLPAGLVLEVPHDIGVYVLAHRLGNILESNVEPDATIEGTIEDLFAEEVEAAEDSE